MTVQPTTVFHQMLEETSTVSLFLLLNSLTAPPSTKLLLVLQTAISHSYRAVQNYVNISAGRGIAYFRVVCKAGCFTAKSRDLVP